jgi:hypothetical protein
MTNKEMAIKIGKTIRELQVRQTALETLLSRVRFENESINWKQTIEGDVKADLAPSTPVGQSVAQLEAELAQASDDSLLEVLYSRIFLPNYS